MLLYDMESMLLNGWVYKKLLIMVEYKYKYEVEMYYPKKKIWKLEKRFYAVKQDVSKFTDNQYRRNFKEVK